MPAQGGKEQLELSKKIFELSSVIDLSKAFIASLDREPIHSKVVFTIMGVVGAKRGALFFHDAANRRLDLHKAVNFPPESEPESLEFTPEECALVEGIARPAFLSELPERGYRFLEPLRGGGIVADPLLIPLVADNNFLGIILLAEKLGSAYSDDDIAMVSSMASYSALALHKKRMVEALIKSEKMADLGRLGSGIVHEIKNPLTSIIMISDVLAEKKGLDEKTKHFVSIIGQEAQRILRLCQNILSLARPKEPEMREVDLGRLVEETLSLVGYELKKHRAEPVLDMGKGVRALGDEEKLKQVLLNLVINAAHAMKGGGNLTIRTRTSRAAVAVPVPKGYRRYAFGDRPPGGAAVLVIRDEGSGIEPSLLERIFEPFFTTKTEGLGTGLGLYVTRNIVLEHRGCLTVMTKPGDGTVFHIELPRAPAAGGRGTGGRRRSAP